MRKKYAEQTKIKNVVSDIFSTFENDKSNQGRKISEKREDGKQPVQKTSVAAKQGTSTTGSKTIDTSQAKKQVATDGFGTKYSITGNEIVVRGQSMNISANQIRTIQAVLKNSGPKNSNKYADEWPEITQNMTIGELIILFESSKRMPLIKSDLKRVIEANLLKSRDAQIAKGKTAKQAVQSGPFQAYVKQASKFEELMTAKVWSTTISEQALNWASLMRTKEMKELVASYKILNSRWSPDAPKAFFTNGYWMTETMANDYQEVLRRWVFLLTIISLFTSGVFTAFRTKEGRIEVRGIDVGDKPMGKDATERDIYTMSIAKDDMYNFTYAELLSGCFVIDPRKLFQNTEFRQTRSKDTRRHEDMRNKIISIMDLVYACAVKINTILNETDQFTKTQNGYFDALRKVKNFFRNVRRSIGGNQLGAKAREADDYYDGGGELDDLMNEFGVNFTMVNVPVQQPVEEAKDKEKVESTSDNNVTP